MSRAYQHEDLWYIETRGDGDKRPRYKWGGYSQDFEAAEKVHSYDEIEKLPRESFAVCGVRDKPHMTRSLLVFDLDVHKAEDNDDSAEQVQIDDTVPIIKSQNGGFHIPFFVRCDKNSLTDSDFDMTKYVSWDVDIKGSAVGGHVVAPGDIPGIDSSYEIVRDTTIPTVSGARDACERVQLYGDPLLEYDDNSGIDSDFGVDRDVDPPDEMPTCYHRGLQLRAANPDGHPNTHKVNTLTALCGLAAGYDIDAMVTHFCEDYPPGESADTEKTQYQLEHMAGKMDSDSLAPPATSTLKEYGILDDGETCSCEIPYHGNSDNMTAMTDGGAMSCGSNPGVEADTPGNNAVVTAFIDACEEYEINSGKVATVSNDGDKRAVGVQSLIGDAGMAKAILTFNRNANLLDGTDKQQIIAHVMHDDLVARGQFFTTTDGRLFYFSDEEKDVYRVDGDGRRTLTESFQGMAWTRYKLSAGRFSRNLGKDLKRKARATAPEREVYQFACYDEDSNELYVSDFGSGYYAISPDEIEWRANGTDVYFLPSGYAEAFEYIKPPERPSLPDTLAGERDLWCESGDPLMRMFGNRVNYDESAALGPTEQRKQLYVHLHTLPFIDLLNARPIMAWVGEKGSGKTVIERSIGRFIYGGEYTESIMPDGKDDFMAKVTNQTLAFLDNYDDGEDWANDVLAAIATGSGLDKRELYTTNGLRREVPRCWLSLTSRDPPFRRDDVADRTLVFRVERVEDGFVGMGDYLNEVTDHRNLLWSTYIDNLQSILAEYHRRDTSSMSSSHRMADWAIFAKIAADALDVTQIDDLLEMMETERATFALENETWANHIADWVSENPDDANTWRKASSLSEKLSEIAQSNGSVFDMSGRGLGSKLSTYHEELSELYNLEIDESGRANQYRFAVDDSSSPVGLGRF